MNTVNTLSDGQLDQYCIDRDEAEMVMEFYHDFAEGLWDINSPNIDTITMLRTSDNGVPEVAFVIYKDGRKNKEMTNYYEDAKTVMYNVEDGDADVDEESSGTFTA